MATNGTNATAAVTPKLVRNELLWPPSKESIVPAAAIVGQMTHISVFTSVLFATLGCIQLFE